MFDEMSRIVTIATSVVATVNTHSTKTPSIVDNLQKIEILRFHTEQVCAMHTTISFTGLSLYSQAKNFVEFQYISGASEIYCECN